MISHRPEDWDCAFCRITTNANGEGAPTRNSDVIYHDSDLTAFLSLHWPVYTPSALSSFFTAFAAGSRRPSRMRMMRGASAAMAVSCVITMTVWP